MDVTQQPGDQPGDAPSYQQWPAEAAALRAELESVRAQASADALRIARAIAHNLPNSSIFLFDRDLRYVATLRERWAAVLARGAAQVTCRYRHADGTFRWVHAHATLVAQPAA